VKVRDAMTRAVISVRPETPLKDVARVLAEHRISGVPVIDADGKVLGIVSEGDFLMKESGAERSRPRLLSWIFAGGQAQAKLHKLEATTAEAAMSRPPVTVEPEVSLRDAAAMMLKRGVNRLPVVAEGALIGIVTRADLVRAYLRPDAVLEQVIREEVIRGTLWMDPDEIDLYVEDGVAFMEGIVDRRSTATILEKLVSQVDGIIRVESQLRWDLDDRGLEPAGEAEREPGAASVTTRERHRPLH
jgi:CBS domain-containing protein